MRRNSFLFLQQQWPEQTTQRFWETDFHFFFWLPPVSRSRNDSLQAFGAAKEYGFLRTGMSSHTTNTHKGRDPLQPTNKKVEIDHRAAPQRKSPRPLSLSQFSSRRDIQPRGALPAAARLDSCDGIRTPSSLSHRNQRRSLSSACRQTEQPWMREGEIEQEGAWLLAAWCCLDYRTYLIPPGFVVLHPSIPSSSGEELTSALHCIVLSELFRAMWRGVV